MRQLGRPWISGAATIILAFASGCASSTASYPTARPTELKVGLRYRAMISGANPYSFAMYDTGLVIFTRISSSKTTGWFSVELSREEARNLLDDLQIDEFLELDSLYDLVPMGADFPTYTIEIRDATTNALKSTSVTGLLSYRGQHYTDEMDKAAPRAFMRVYERLSSFDPPGGHPWFPEYLLVSVFSNPALKPGAGSACPWPKGWPTLKSEGSLPPDGPDPTKLGTIRLKGDQLTAYRLFRDDCFNRTRRTEVLLDGQPVLMGASFKLPAQPE